MIHAICDRNVLRALPLFKTSIQCSCNFHNSHVCSIFFFNQFVLFFLHSSMCNKVPNDQQQNIMNMQSLSWIISRDTHTQNAPLSPRIAVLYRLHEPRYLLTIHGVVHSHNKCSHMHVQLYIYATVKCVHSQICV